MIQHVLRPPYHYSSKNHTTLEVFVTVHPWAMPNSSLLSKKYIPPCNLCNSNTNDTWVHILSTYPNRHIINLCTTRHNRRVCCIATISKSQHVYMPRIAIKLHMMRAIPQIFTRQRCHVLAPSMHLLCSPMLMPHPIMTKCLHVHGIPLTSPFLFTHTYNSYPIYWIYILQ